jgi:tripartite-type tricarboxylate transporter receptor subunit TctC
MTRDHPTPCRRRLLQGAAAGSALALVPFRSNGQQPAVRLLVGYPTGGAVDVAARALAEPLRAALGSSVVVENRPGASGTLPVDTLRQAPADGNTLLFTPPDVPAIFPHVMSSLRYDAARDLLPVAQVCTFSFGLGVGPATPARTLAEFLDWCRANPDKANFGTPGVGSTMHFLGEEIARTAKVPLKHVPYKGGAQAIVDVVGGQIPALISTAPILVPQQRAGKIRVLAVTSSARSPRLPDVPTFREAGMPQLEEDSWFGVFVRTGTPSEAVARLAAAISQAVASPAFVQAMEKLDFEPEFAGPAAFSVGVKAMSDRWAERARRTGFRADS